VSSALFESTASRPAGVRGWMRATRTRLERRGVPEGIRITRVGLWFVLFTVIVAVAATNTGNNALYLVLACMLSLLVVSGVVSRWNLRHLETAIDTPGDLYAKRPFELGFTITNRSRRIPRWLLLFSVERKGAARLIPYLPPGKSARGTLDFIVPRRGRRRIEAAHFSSLFPLGLFRKGMRYPASVDLLVYPELFPAGAIEAQPAGTTGDDASSRAGWGHELHALRAYRSGDDPRAIHWKKSAQAGALVFMERANEESERLSIVFDNATGKLRDAAAEERFEYLVSEAATAAVDHLARGFEVELVTRDRRLPFGAGSRQRRAILDYLALVEPRPKAAPGSAAAVFRGGDSRARVLRLSFGEGDL
jgi:uncharacterized protein (DUF58 family)